MSKPEVTTRLLPVRNYDLAATLTSGQAFRWKPCVHSNRNDTSQRPFRHRGSSSSSAVAVHREHENAAPQISKEDGADSRPLLQEAWEGVVAGRWVRLSSQKVGISVEVAESITDWSWLERYLHTSEDIEQIYARFPKEAPLREAVAACGGLRLLQQDPWECLASFILSSTKQIVQIQQIVERLCCRYGEPIAVPEGRETGFAFPSAARLAQVSESELRESRMGFRAKYLRAAAETVATGALDLEALRRLPLPEARARLTALPGVGRKIADCVLLFSLGFRTAFPVDVWIASVLRSFYFRQQRISTSKLIAFAESHFGSQAGYAQQYLFHYARLNPGLAGTRPRRTNARIQHDPH